MRDTLYDLWNGRSADGVMAAMTFQILWPVSWTHSESALRYLSQRSQLYERDQPVWGGEREIHTSTSTNALNKGLTTLETILSSMRQWPSSPHDLVHGHGSSYATYKGPHTSPEASRFIHLHSCTSTTSLTPVVPCLSHLPLRARY